MRIDVLTLFPNMFISPFQESILKRAQQRGHLTLLLHQIRDYAFDRHQMTDDLPYGGGRGMVMKPEPIFRAVSTILRGVTAPIILLSPQGRTFTQQIAIKMAQQPRILLICGHYEGVDERVRGQLITDEISVGDYVLTGGELAAMIMVDAISRCIPGVLGNENAAIDDSYASGLLEGPHYTRPSTYAGTAVPEVLRSGNHAVIARWKRERALQRTYLRRPDLFEGACLTDEDLAFLDELRKLQHDPGEPDEE